MKKINIAVIGAGTVGGGAVKILSEQLSFFQEKLNLPLHLHTVADRDEAVVKALPLNGANYCSNAFDVINNPEIDIVVELVGGTTVAKDIVLGALKAGKHVVTANKALIAHYGPELFALAEEMGVSLYFEASVGGGMPTIKTIREALVANNILSVHTIINGTCNYILTEMSEKGAGFAETLAKAQELGYAEADPTLDIGGGDTGHKVAILASLLFGKYVSYEQLSVEGITDIEAADILAAEELGYSIKLLGVVKQSLGKDAIDVRVHPVMVHKEHMLSNVNGVFNAVLVEGDAVGPVLIYGKGAGEMATASAVVSDIVDVARNILSSEPVRVPMGYYNTNNRATLIDPREIESRYYLRFGVKNEPGVLSKISEALANQGISIASVSQKEDDTPTVSFVILTFLTNEHAMQSALELINNMPFITEPTKLIRIED